VHVFQVFQFASTGDLPSVK